MAGQTLLIEGPGKLLRVLLRLGEKARKVERT
jgi:hypothetical protein